ncbi:LOW QUALITY PROTEIN: hypothetical protein OSB04_029067 [Centaurea solstitialis]|uniref:Integrase catalytic domain-containing protein n=1 Tax=Centaurea solstitialis TaxID=347529 RepID=A0AA38STV3_9ASTR|nr:LOW QUALITY PROTEIN: hypothetical protein OSB04_029067 [Centaurea solstitialis]
MNSLGTHGLNSLEPNPMLLIESLPSSSTSKFFWVIRSYIVTMKPNFAMQNYNPFLEAVGISHNISAVCTPQQNGIVERRNRTLVEAARSMMAYSGIPQSFWAEAVSTACFMQNRTLIVKQMGKTAYEMIEIVKRKPNIDFFRVFGCKCYVLNDRDDLGKFNPKSDESIFIGYSLNSGTYRVYDKRTRSILESSNVDFSETETFSNACSSSTTAILPELLLVPYNKTIRGMIEKSKR